MTTPNPRELLSAYLDDEVTVEERARVEAWLEESAEGREELRELDELGEMLRVVLNESNGEVDLVGDVSEAISAPTSTPGPTPPTVPPSRRPSGAGWMAVASLATSVVAVLVTAALLNPPGSTLTHDEIANVEFAEGGRDLELATAAPAHNGRVRLERVEESIATARAEAPSEAAMPSPEADALPSDVEDRFSDDEKGRTLYLDGRDLAARKKFVVPRGSVPDDVEAGDVIPLYETREDRVAVVRVTVVDVRRALGEVQVLLHRNNVAPIAEEPESKPVDGLDAEKTAGEAGTFAVYVSAPPAQLNAALASLRANEQVVGLVGPRNVVAALDAPGAKPGGAKAAAATQANGPRLGAGEVVPSAGAARADGGEGAFGGEAGQSLAKAEKRKQLGSYQLLGPVASADRTGRRHPEFDEERARQLRSRAVRDLADDATAAPDPQTTVREAKEGKDANVRVLLLLEAR